MGKDEKQREKRIILSVLMGKVEEKRKLGEAVEREGRRKCLFSETKRK